QVTEEYGGRLSIRPGMIIVPTKTIDVRAIVGLQLERLLNHQTCLIEINASVDVHVPQIIVSLRRFGRVKFDTLLKEPGGLIDQVRLLSGYCIIKVEGGIPHLRV